MNLSELAQNPNKMYEFFEDNATAPISRKDVEKWLLALGDITQKPALRDKDQVKEFTRLFEEDLECQTGIEYMMMQEEDLVDAGVKKLTARLILHYMQPQHKPEAAASEIGQEGLLSPASGQAASATSGKSAAETIAETLTDALDKNAEQNRKTVKETTERKALKKLAGAAGEQLPKVQATLKWVESIETDRTNYSSAWAAGASQVPRCPPEHKSRCCDG